LENRNWKLKERRKGARLEDERSRQEGFEMEPNFFWCWGLFFSWKCLAARDRSLDYLEWSCLACQIAEEADLPSS
jgi:hypothetical protein